MPYTAAHGPPSVNASHQWNPAGAEAPPPINYRATDPVTYPWSKLLQIPGWRSKPEADDLREARTSGPGEIGYPGLKLGKTIVYEAELRAQSELSLDLTMTQLVNGFADDQNLGTMTVTPRPAIGGVTWEYQARVIDLTVDPSWTYDDHRPWLFSWGYALSLRMLDPYFYTPNLAGTAYL